MIYRDQYDRRHVSPDSYICGECGAYNATGDSGPEHSPDCSWYAPPYPRDMTAADIGLDAVWKPLYQYCREYQSIGTMNDKPIYVCSGCEGTLWR